jgi:SAM-dependent methyltransferase
LEKKWLFDRQWTRDFTGIRQKFIAEFLGNVRPQMGLGSALDVGCGVGDFSKFLSELGFSVIAVDGREENVTEAKRRYPEISYRVANVENLPVAEMGTFDLVLCFGLLYHLENPFRAIRNLHSLTGRVLLIETMCTPYANTTMELLDEGHCEDQGLNYVAFYPSESTFVKMLYRAGFPFVYRFERLPVHELYTKTLWRKRLRTMLVTSKIALTAPNLALVRDQLRPVPGRSDPWTTPLSRLRDFLVASLFKLRVFAARIMKPWRRKVNPARSGRRLHVAGTTSVTPLKQQMSRIKETDENGSRS